VHPYPTGFAVSQFRIVIFIDTVAGAGGPASSASAEGSERLQGVKCVGFLLRTVSRIGPQHGIPSFHESRVLPQAVNTAGTPEPILFSAQERFLNIGRGYRGFHASATLQWAAVPESQCD
jgi:hypothetical protein